MAVLSKYAWKPILAQLKRREETIASALERAEKREIEAQTILHQYQTRLESVENEAKDILDESRKEAVSLREQTLEEARAEARRSVEAAHESIDQAKRDALRELRERTGEMATEVAEQVLRRSLSDEEHRRLLAESMKELARGAGGRN
jgi:F-type H+-transporting ATPase subunit b